MSMNDLYQNIIMRHFKSPQHYGPVTDEEMRSEVENPTCGDHFRLAIDLDANGAIESVRFDGKGCAISTASCSLMTERVIGMSVGDATNLADSFVRGMKSVEPIDAEEWGDLRALEGVKKFPLRVKCATLCWVALAEALADMSE